MTFQDLYTKQNNLTLREALQMHYQLNPQFTSFEKYSNSFSSKMIKAHDIAHIIFGCDTSYSGEYAVQTWVKCGVKQNLNWKELPNFIFNKDLIGLVLPPKLIQYSMTHILEFVKIKKKIKEQAKFMNKKWNYFTEEDFMDRTIEQIREEFGIKLA